MFYLLISLRADTKWLVVFWPKYEINKWFVKGPDFHAVYVIMPALKNVYLYRTVSVLWSEFSELLTVGVA